MPPFVFDEERVELLTQRFRTGGDGAAELAAIVERRIDEIRGLERPDAIRIGAIGFGSDGGGTLPNEFAVAVALQNANLNLDGLSAAARTLDSLSGVWVEASTQLRQRIADIQAATITADDLADGDLLADIRAERPEDVTRVLGSSIRGSIPDAPQPGEDPELDAVIARFDSALLPGLLTGELDTSDLSDQQRSDLQIITELLGGDEETFTRRRREFVEVAGEDQSRIVTTEVPFSEADPELQALFISRKLGQQGAANTLAAAIGSDDAISIVRGEGGGNGDSQSSVSGEITLEGGGTITTEVVDNGDGVQQVTITDQTTGTQFSGIRTETGDGGFAATGDITFADGSTGRVDVIDDGENRTITVESEDARDRDSDFGRDLAGIGTTFTSLITSFADVFSEFSLFDTGAGVDGGDGGTRVVNPTADRSGAPIPVSAATTCPTVSEQRIELSPEPPLGIGWADTQPVVGARRAGPSARST